MRLHWKQIRYKILNDTNRWIERSQYGEEGSNGLLGYRVSAEMEKYKDEERIKDEKRGGGSHSMMISWLNSNSSSGAYCRSEAVG